MGSRVGETVCACLYRYNLRPVIIRMGFLGVYYTITLRRNLPKIVLVIYFGPYVSSFLREWYPFFAASPECRPFLRTLFRGLDDYQHVMLVVPCYNRGTIYPIHFILTMQAPTVLPLRDRSFQRGSTEVSGFKVWGFGFGGSSSGRSGKQSRHVAKM